MAVNIPIFGLDWHIRQSPAQRILVGDPLQPYIQFEQISWDGENIPALNSQAAKSNTLVFFQLPPPPNLLEKPNARIIWIPMWDEARGYTKEWWQKLPKHLRVVAFSKKVSDHCAAAGLDFLEIRYFPSTDKFPKSAWGNDRILFYWNRSGLVGKKFLASFCRSLDIRLFIHLHTANSDIPTRLAYRLPERLGDTRVENVEIGPLLPRPEYLRLLRQANVFLAPRASEGVGLSLLEAMAQGCAVFAYDAATMNEYIAHKSNGYLFRKYGRTGLNHFCGGASRRIREFRQRALRHPKPLEHPITEWQDWREIGRLDLGLMGDRARQAQSVGHQEWIASIPRFASFILDW
jgi:hypothetical protein